MYLLVSLLACLHTDYTEHLKCFSKINLTEKDFICKAHYGSYLYIFVIFCMKVLKKWINLKCIFLIPWNIIEFHYFS